MEGYTDKDDGSFVNEDHRMNYDNLGEENSDRDYSYANSSSELRASDCTKEGEEDISYFGTG